MITWPPRHQLPAIMTAPIAPVSSSESEKKFPEMVT